MAIDEKAVFAMINAIAVEGRIPTKIVNLMYRPDAQDYLVLFEDDSITTIREKLINFYHEQKLADVKREILGRLKAAEHVDVSGPPPEEEEKISVEDDDKI